MSDADYPEIKLYINGEWSDGAGGRGDDIVNPATEEVLGRVPFAEAGQVDAAIAAAAAAFPKWRDAGPDVRSKILLKTAPLLHQRADEIGRVMTLEEGKSLGEAVGEVHRAAAGLEWNTEEGRRAYGRIIPSGPDEILSVRVTPVGPVGAFVPWNFPAGGPMRKISAALAAGNSIVIKPSEEVPATVSLIARAFEDAGLPPGVLNLLFGVPDEISRRVIADPRIRFIAFTGSDPGRQAPGRAGRPGDEAGPHGARRARPGHRLRRRRPGQGGQERRPGQDRQRRPGLHLAQPVPGPPQHLRPVHRGLHRGLAAFKVGNGLEPGVQMGPMVNHRRLASVQKLIEDAVSRGATVTTGGKPIEGTGFFFQPTVLTDVPADAAILHEEPFGPVAPVAAFDDLDDALELANSLPFGLAAYAYTDSAATAEKLIAGYEAGHPVDQPLRRLAAAGPVGRLQGERLRPRGRPRRAGGATSSPSASRTSCTHDLVPV